MGRIRSLIFGASVGCIGGWFLHSQIQMQRDHFVDKIHDIHSKIPGARIVADPIDGVSSSIFASNALRGTINEILQTLRSEWNQAVVTAADKVSNNLFPKNKDN